MPMSRRYPRTDGFRRDPFPRPLLRAAPGNGSGPDPRCRSFPSLPSPLSLLLRSILLVALTPPIVPEGRAGAGEDTIAVLAVVGGSKPDRDAAALVTDAIRREVVATGRYRVLDQGRLTPPGRDRSSKFLHCAKKECAVEAGKLVGARTVIVGKLTRSGEAFYLTLSRVDVGSRTVAFVVEDRSAVDTEDLLRMGRGAAKKLLGDEQPVPRRAAGPEDERFVVSESTVFDNETKLTWMRAPHGDGKPLAWDEANEAVQRLNRTRYAEFDNWRLPDKDELATLLGYAHGRGVRRNLHELFTRIGFRNVKAELYWSATTSEDMPGLVWTIDLYGGEISVADKTGKGCVWPVRTGPWLFEERSGRP